jgi:glycopeptide antibiotics resistance protein
MSRKFNVFVTNFCVYLAYISTICLFFIFKRSELKFTANFAYATLWLRRFGDLGEGGGKQNSEVFLSVTMG